MHEEGKETDKEYINNDPCRILVPRALRECSLSAMTKKKTRLRKTLIYKTLKALERKLFPIREMPT